MKGSFGAVLATLATFVATGAVAQTSDVRPKPPKPTVDSMIDDILKSKQPVQEVTRPAPATSASASPLTASEIESVRQKIRPCWNTQQGRITDKMIITVTVEMNQDGKPAKAALRDAGRYYSSDQVYRAAADAALKAIMDPRCHPWPLPLEKYQSWKTMTFNFDPRDF
ncbi:MAG: tolA [Reyranella sp.]|nr:tolA [Reyranella sp.]